MLSRWLSHPGKQVLFAVLSLADLALTWWLLGSTRGQVYEANPVAHWWLSRHGWAGLAAFKALVVLLVAVLTAVIARSRPRAAGRVLGLGCAVLAGVVLYSATLCAASGWLAEDPAVFDRHLDGLNRQAQQTHQDLTAYHARRARMCADLVAGRCTLREATDWVLASEKGKDFGWLRGEAVLHPDRSTRELITAYVIRHAVLGQDETQAALRVALRLEREFQLLYGSPPPHRHSERLAAAGAEQGREPGMGPRETVPTRSDLSRVY